MPDNLTARLPVLITTAQFRDEVLNISPAAFDRLKAADGLPAHVEFGRAHRWRRDEVLAWVAAGCPPRAEWEERRTGFVKPS